MNKAELVEKIAADAELSKASADRVLSSVIDNIIKAVTKGGVVQLIGFGTFAVEQRAARIGRNPATGKELKIPAKRVTKFKVGSKLKEAVAGKGGKKK